MKEAVRDYAWLLDRGYPAGRALMLVAERYSLESGEISVLKRGVFPINECEERRRKRVERFDFVDGYNQLYTIEALLEGKAFLARDGFVRDAEERHGSGKVSEKALELLLERAGDALVVLDSPVSHSGELAARIREAGGQAETAKSPDFVLKKKNFVATSDTVIIDSLKHAADIPAQIALKLGIALPPLC